MNIATSNLFFSFASIKREESDLLLSDEQQRLLPTKEDIEFFQTHGWFITKKIIPDAVIDRIYAASEELYQGKKDADLPIEGCCNWKLGDQVAIRNNEYISFQKKEFRELSLQPIIGAIAAKLMNTKTVRYFQDQLVSKEPKTNHTNTKVGWHTDRSYHSNCTSDKLLTAWIPLHDVNIEHGPLVMIDGSHKWSETEHMRGFNHDNHGEVEQKFIQQKKEFKKVPLILQKGQISFHHSSIIHGSYENYSNIMRRAIVLNVQDGENCYRTFWNQDKQIHHFLDRLCRPQVNGLPDYSDPAVFPVIWSEKTSVDFAFN